MSENRRRGLGSAEFWGVIVVVTGLFVFLDTELRALRSDMSGELTALRSEVYAVRTDLGERVARIEVLLNGRLTNEAKE